MSQVMIEQDQMPGFVESLNGLPSVWNTPFFETGYVTALAQGGLMLVTGEDAATFLNTSPPRLHAAQRIAQQKVVCWQVYCIGKRTKALSFSFQTNCCRRFKKG